MREASLNDLGVRVCVGGEKRCFYTCFFFSRVLFWLNYFYLIRFNWFHNFETKTKLDQYFFNFLIDLFGFFIIFFFLD
jgi:hypothetical protein